MPQAENQFDQKDVPVPKGVTKTPNVEWQDAQFPFDGAWMPDMDPALIGARNFATLTNLRYTDKSIEGVNGFSKINTTALDTYIDIDNLAQLRTNRTVRSYLLAHAAPTPGGQGRVYINTTTPGSDGDFDSTSRFDTSGNAYRADISSGLQGRFSTAPQSSVAYCNGNESLIYSGAEHRIAAAFLQKGDADTSVKEVSDELISTLTTDEASIVDGTFDELIIMTTRPVQGFKFYVGTANTVASVMTITKWNGSAWDAVANFTDNTIAVAGKTLSQTGTVVFDHTEGTTGLKHYQELYLFAYKITFSGANNGTVYHVTCDPAFNYIQNVWDGVYRQPIQFQVFSADHYEDYTLQVNQSSDLNAPIGAQIDGLVAATDSIYVMFEEQMSAIKFTMLGDLINKAASVISLSYWTGDSWTAVSNFVDGTKNTGGTVSFNQTGLASWNPSLDEQKQTLFGSLGYAYKITFTGANLTGTKSGTAEVLIDLCSGIPKLAQVKAFDFPVMYKNRLMLCGFTSGGEGNRMDYSAPNAPDVFNGSESSDDGANSIYFGGDEPITGAIQLFNRFGASIFAMLLVFKDTETYLMTGDTPEDFVVYPVSQVVGCPAPLTIATTEISLEGGENLARNFVVWLSHAGPVMFDGAVLAPIKGVDNYFDPNETTYINWTYIHTARGWIDPNYKEWNLIIPTGGSTTANVWLAYDLMRRKWYRRDPGGGGFPVSGASIMNPATGEQFAVAGMNDGHVMQLEDGTTFDGVAIEQIVKTGDFWPSQNIWDYTTLRKYKLITKKINTDEDVDVAFFYYGNTEPGGGTSATFTDGDVVFTDGDVVFTDATASTFDLSISAESQRVVQKIIDLNKRGWAHAFELRVTTSTTPQGFSPIVWGVRYRVERKDDTANIQEQT